MFHSSRIRAHGRDDGPARAFDNLDVDVSPGNVATGPGDRARCLANSTGWDAGEIWTLTNFEITETWRGSASGRIRVRLLGGKVGNLTSSVSSVPRFRPGEEVVLFLEPTKRGDYSVVGWQEGTFRIRRDAHTGEENATQDTASLATFNPQTRRFETNGVRNLPVDSLRKQVDAALRLPTSPKR
jgi:hypothetical protein